MSNTLHTVYSYKSMCMRSLKRKRNRIQRLFTTTYLVINIEKTKIEILKFYSQDVNVDYLLKHILYKIQLFFFLLNYYT